MAYFLGYKELVIFCFGPVAAFATKMQVVSVWLPAPGF